MFERAKGRAGRAGIPFSISLSDIIVPDVCPILGVPLVRGTIYAPSLDRIKAHLGYVPGNVQVISARANVIKNDATVEELRAVLDFVTRIG